MTASAEKTWNELCQFVRRTALLASVEGLLDWDEHTMLPESGHAHRGEQMALVAGMVHQRRCDGRIGQWLGELETSRLADDPDGPRAASLRELRRQYDRDRKLPQSLVEELKRATVAGQHAWAAARQRDDFASFRPHLERIVELKRQEADAVGYEETRYDALLDEYEPGQRAAQLAPRLAALGDDLTALVRRVVASGREAPRQALYGDFPIDRQEQFGREAAERIGFDFAAGRLDVTAHPFCAGIGPGDCRLTTHYDPQFFPSGFYSILHEAGHGLYEQGLRPEDFGLPLGESASLGVHESQSRMWENFVGRNLDFWRHFYPSAQRRFPAALDGVGLADFHFAVNDVRPSLIRIEADEATYNLHILVRFELERDLIAGDLAVADLPAAWNDKYEASLGVRPPNDAQGVLQDIHWSAGLIGYFPTYTLGNLYAAQLYEAAERDLGGLDEPFRRGEFRGLLDWLRRHVHSHGKRYRAEDLIERATGAPPGPEPLIRHLRRKLGPLYGIA